MKSFARFARILAVTVFSAVTGNVLAGEKAPAQGMGAHSNGVFAEVDGESITLQEYQAALNAGMRQRFYHGKIPQEQIKAFRNDVSQSLVDRVLLVKEGKRRGFKIDEKVINEQLLRYEQRYQKTADWAQHKDEIREGLRRALEEEEVVRLLKATVQDVAEPSNDEVKTFYNKRKDLFTTPEQIRVSVILLKVAASSGSTAWAAAQAEAEQLVGKLRKGADFVELARIHSGDESASRGGDMGLLHKGMLAPAAEQSIEKIKVGEVTDPLLMLQGIAIFRLDERKLAVLNPYEAVADRARALLKRELAETSWTDLLVALRAKASIKYHLAGI